MSCELRGKRVGFRPCDGEERAESAAKMNMSQMNMSQMYEDGKKALSNNLSTLRSNIKSPLKINR